MAKKKQGIVRRKVEAASDWLDKKLKAAIKYLNVIKQMLRLWDYIVEKIDAFLSKFKK
jgi:hypothetical protein